MRTGKLTPGQLQDAVFANTTFTRPEVVQGAALGEDSAVLDLAGDLCVLSTDPITGASAGLGRLAVQVSLNDVATSGGEPVAMLITIMAPPGTSMEEIAGIMSDAAEEANAHRVAIVGGHTEVTAAVNQTIVSTTVVGRVPQGSLKQVSATRPGASLVMVRTAGLEGTAIIAHDHGDMLLPHLSADDINEARALADEISVVSACRIAAKAGALGMHDVTEGGVLGAAYEMAQAAGLTLAVSDDIPVHRLTAKICSALGLDPLRLISSGTLLVATLAPERLLAALAEACIAAAVIGYFEEGPPRTLFRGGELPPPHSDELWRLKERLAGGVGSA